MPAAPKPPKRKVDPTVYPRVAARDGVCMWGVKYQGKEGGICQGRLHFHHILYRGRGGSDTMDNLITLCARHHQYVHDNNIDPQILRDLIKE